MIFPMRSAEMQSSRLCASVLAYLLGDIQYARKMHVESKEDNLDGNTQGLLPRQKGLKDF